MAYSILHAPSLGSNLYNLSSSGLGRYAILYPPLNCPELNIAQRIIVARGAILNILEVPYLSLSPLFTKLYLNHEDKFGSEVRRAKRVKAIYENKFVIKNNIKVKEQTIWLTKKAL